MSRPGTQFERTLFTILMTALAMTVIFILVTRDRKDPTGINTVWSQDGYSALISIDDTLRGVTCYKISGHVELSCVKH